MVIVETIDDDGYVRFKHAYKNPCRLEIDMFGNLKLLHTEKYCKTCNGSGGIKYWYASDDSKTVLCPVCNGGNIKEWEKAKEEWKSFRG